MKELIQAAPCTVFFVDDDQRVTLRDVGHAEELRRWARILNAEVTELELSSQFRCNGSDSYLAWLEGTLAIRPTANPMLGSDEFDFRVLDSPVELHELIELKNRASNKARVVAGYCWEWPSKRNPRAWDIEIAGFGYRRQWNLDKDSSLWIVAPDSVEQVGCIHTCQGLELDYVGVIIGPDLVYKDGRVCTQPKQRAKSDASLKGLGPMMRADPQAAQAVADRIIKNTYRTLMTRGMRGCYVYCTDPALAAYLRSRLNTRADPLGPELGLAPPAPIGSNVFPLRRVTEAERSVGVPSAPIVTLRFAAGAFSDPQALQDGATGLRCQIGSNRSPACSSPK